ncbi:hypothetical protein BDV97DRAFT_360422 [Delphinella strobiligena]|nr:hypothetical protein BDV97DRAFT_360422 [Delphinella strobiligena]
MDQRENDDAEVGRRYKAPYTGHHQIPTIQQYHQDKEDRKTNYASPNAHRSRGSGSDSDAANRYLDSNEHSEDPSQDEGPEAEDGQSGSMNKSTGRQGDDGEQAVTEDTSEALGYLPDPKKRRKALGKRRGDRAEREVTDPVTHLPVRIHDLQASDLKRVPENLAPPGLDSRTATGLQAKSKTDDDLKSEAAEIQRYHHELENLFPPPEYDAVKNQLIGVYSKGIVAGLVSMAIVAYIFLAFERGLGGDAGGLFAYMTGTGLTLAGMAALIAIIAGVRTWMSNKISNIWEEELWHAQRHDGSNQNDNDDPDIQESTHWLNNMLTSIWPIVNPDLFISLADTLEDVMQASLPSIVRMVSIEDIGQGSESIRILGVRWLPTGAAARSVDSSGKISQERNPDQTNDRAVPGEGNVDQKAEENEDNPDNTTNGKPKKNEATPQQQTQIAEGMEAEEGDFINLEVAFAYRTRSSAQKFKDRAKHAHLYIAFYLPGRIKLPVYVDLRGVVGIARLRLQITPDPPFFSLCTFTFLGQPKVDVACLPLTRKGLNIMDLPLISNFVQTAIDAAMAEYVAPKSMTLDLKDMLAGDDFKKDTIARGVVVCKIKRAFDFKQGDAAIPLIRDGSADPYVTLGWAKFVKPLWSTRVIINEMEPHWEETGFLLVTPDELNVDERLRVQLWDSDRMTADDDLGRIEIDLKKLMRDPETRGRMSDRIDGFKALKAGEGMPGKLEWSVGYFAKSHIRQCQFENQTAEPDIRTKEKLEQVVNETSERKLRETKHDESSEREQIRLQQYKEIEDRMIISAPPLSDYPSGTLAIQIHECTGLEVRALHNAARHNDDNEHSDEEEQSDELPSSYCNIIINHEKVYRTRVKPKNQKPFFNAGTERFIRDWRNTMIHIAVRDSRIHEDDPLLGLVRLSLGDVFRHRCQINNSYPLYGGVGYGRVRISLVFRSVEMQAPQNLIGWNYGTLVIKPKITAKDLPSDLHGLKLKLETSISSGHMYSKSDDEPGHHWKTTKDKRLLLAVRKRYSAPLVIQFRKDRHLLHKNKTAAFAVLWLIDLSDDEEQEITLSVWKGDLKRATTCYLRECGEKVGEIKLTLTFCKGLDKAHRKLASKDPSLRDVMEVIEASDFAERENNKQQIGATTSVKDKGINDHIGRDPTKDKPHSLDSDSADSSDSYSDADAEPSRPTTADAPSNPLAQNRELEKSGDRDLGSAMTDYKTHARQMHRRHRGIMQYKSARTMWWMKHKVSNAQDRISDVFSHHDRGSGIETEA